MFFLVRHAERCDNVETVEETSRITNEYDPPITHRGQEQARAAGLRIKALIEESAADQEILIISSPFLRWHETASLIGEGVGVSDITLNYGLGEFMHAHWFPTNPYDNLSVPKLGLPQHTANIPPAYPETTGQMAARYTSTCASLISKFVAKGKIVVAVTHGYGVYFFLDNNFNQVNTEVDFTAITQVTTDGEFDLKLKLAADASHIEGIQ